MHLETKEVVAGASAFLVAVSTAYLFGYWGAFNVNVLEFIGVTDIAKIAIYPLLISVASFVAGTLIWGVLLGDAFPPGGGADTPIGQFGRKHARVLLTINVLLVYATYLFAPEPGRWFLVAALIALLSNPLTHLEPAIRWLPNPRLRQLVLLYVVILPWLSFAAGRLAAHDVKTGHPANIVDIERSMLPLKNDAQHPVAYLGFVGDTHVLFESLTSQVVYVKQQGSTPLHLIPRQR